MSNTNNRTITIGMKYSGREFVIEESKIEEDKFKQFTDNLIEAMDGDNKGVSIIDENKDYLYFASDSIAYLTITKD